MKHTTPFLEPTQVGHTHIHKGRSLSQSLSCSASSQSAAGNLCHKHAYINLVVGFILLLCALALAVPMHAYASAYVIVSNENARVYPSKSTSGSGVHVSAGTKLSIRESSYSTWYTVTGGASGLPSPGYIHKTDVETSLKGSSTIKHGTVSSSVKMYAYPSTSAPVVKTLSSGDTLQWAMYNVDWAWASVNGTTVFFKTDGIAAYTASSSSISRGAVIDGTISIKRAPTSSASTLESYPDGSTFQFIDFNSGFYCARFSNGTLGYIDKGKIRLYNPQTSSTFSKQAGSEGAYAYSSPSISSTKLASYPPGKVLSFADFDGTWYMARVNVSGTSKLAFFKASEFGEVATQASGEMWLIAARENAPIHTSQGSSSSSLRVRKGTMIKGSALGDGWYQCTYYSGGKSKSGYVKTSDFREMTGNIKIVIGKTYYAIDYRKALNNQLKKGKDNKYWNASGKFVSAPTSLTEWYFNPNNIVEGSTSFLQFLKLDVPTGASVSAMNAQLKGMGTLEGTGAAFREGAYASRVNEFYLMAHALHETGNGTSNLARGLYYKPSEGKAYDYYVDGSTKVYNMYGIGATDANPRHGGAKFAYEQGWTSPEKAVVGGAEFVGKNYFRARSSATLSGQNTLYKMLWHPEWNAVKNELPWHQYATDIAWAENQTYNLARFYADYSAYTMTFDVPVYR